MISVGIDVSKGKSTVCILKPCGEIVSSPFDVEHTDSSLSELANMILRLEDEVKVVMEATGAYHVPVLTFLTDKKIFVSVINPLVMKEYRCKGLRKAKTDRLDSKMIANYGLDNWFHLREYSPVTETYQALKLLGRQYAHYMRMRIESMQVLTNMLDYTMPGIKTLLKGYSEATKKNKLSDFVEHYWHYDNITKKSETQFVKSYIAWAKKKGYHQSQAKAIKIYALAKDGIPTLPSSSPSTKMLVLEAVRVLRELETTLKTILSQMQDLARDLPEYPVVRAMGGVGNTIAVRLIAEIGDTRRFYNGKALVAYAGIDSPPYQSGQFNGSNRHITKRGSANLRKIGFEIMLCLKSLKPVEDPVYWFMIKKEAEGKAHKVAKMAALNKFLRIYYARVMEVYA
jgi:transposase